MIRTLGLLSIALASFFVAGCQESRATGAAEKSADKEEKKLAVGDQAPAWEALAGTDDKKHSLKDLKETKAIAVVFTCNTCPVAVAYEDRMIQLAKDYKDKGVELVAINVNGGDKNDLEAMKERAEKKGLPYAYLCDPSQEIGRKFGAATTPHVFLLDKDRKVAYVGAIDDSPMNADGVKERHLADAIDAVLAGKEPAVTKTKNVGCGIHYE